MDKKQLIFDIKIDFAGKKRNKKGNLDLFFVGFDPNEDDCKLTITIDPELDNTTLFNKTGKKFKLGIIELDEDEDEKTQKTGPMDKHLGLNFVPHKGVPA